MEQFEYRGYSFEVQNEGGTMTQSQYQKMIDLLEENRPVEIIEFGCGQSTIIFEKYIGKYKGNLISIEQDAGYKRKDTVVFPVVEPGKLVIGNKEYGKCNYYDGLEDFLKERNVKYDFISIDGPIGCGFREYFEYGRVQLLDFAILDLMKDKCIVQIHDAQRVNMRNTYTEFEKILKEKGYVWSVEEIGSGNNNPALLRVYSISRKIVL